MVFVRDVGLEGLYIHCRWCCQKSCVWTEVSLGRRGISYITRCIDGIRLEDGVQVSRYPNCDSVDAWNKVPTEVAPYMLWWRKIPQLAGSQTIVIALITQLLHHIWLLYSWPCDVAIEGFKRCLLSSLQDFIHLLKGKDAFWIGLRRSPGQPWTWLNGDIATWVLLFPFLVQIRLGILQSWEIMVTCSVWRTWNSV